MTPHRTKSRYAFATILMLFVLGLVMVSLATLVTVLSMDQRRTASVMSQARLRQLLLAATIDTTRRASTWGGSPKPQQWTIDPPQAAGTVKVELIDAPKSQARVRLTAEVGQSRVIEILRYAPVDAKWHLVAVEPG